MLTDQEVKLTAEEIERLITTSMGAKFFRIAEHPIIRIMYEAAREKAGGDPITFLAAKRLVDVIKPGDVVFISTGFMIANYMEGEIDGPLGAAALARALSLAFDATPILITEEKLLPIVAETCKAIGLHCYDLERARELPRRFAAMSFPVDSDRARKRAVELIEGLRPTAIISTERPGANPRGVHHSRLGLNLSPITAKIDILIEEARSRGVFTIGIGDGGNEIGMGVIRDTVLKYIPKADRCNCPCGAGTAAATETDILIPAFVSDWGAYGIEACLALLLDRPELMHDGPTTERMLNACIMNGAISSPYGLSEAAVDGLPGKYNTYVVDIINFIVNSRMHETKGAQRYRKSADAELERLTRIIEREAKLAE
ncbi:MAG: DUF4392 domain-containing protein [Bacillota bacterium]|nr:DUF4392 domain-containing protein [Bacillota bacterium]